MLWGHSLLYAIKQGERNAPRSPLSLTPSFSLGTPVSVLAKQVNSAYLKIATPRSL